MDVPVQSSMRSAVERASDIAHRCKNATAKGEGWMVCCPAHNDTTPSLSIDAKGTNVVLNCFGGCDAKAIMAVLGLPMSSLFTEPRASTHSHNPPIRRVYDYPDEQGTVVHETVRYDTALKEDRFRQRRPDPANPGEYLWNLKGITPVLYNLPAVLQAIRAGETIHLAEGESDAETLIAQGVAGTTAPMGASFWHESFTTTLTGADVVVWPASIR